MLEEVTITVASLKSVVRRSGSVAVADEIVSKGLIGGATVEIATATQRQGLGERRLEVAMRTLDGAVLVAHAAIVAGRRHAVMATQLTVGPREVFLHGEILERRREARGAMRPGRS